MAQTVDGAHKAHHGFYFVGLDYNELSINFGSVFLITPSPTIGFKTLYRDTTETPPMYFTTCAFYRQLTIVFVSVLFSLLQTCQVGLNFASEEETKRFRSQLQDLIGRRQRKTGTN